MPYIDVRLSQKKEVETDSAIVEKLTQLLAKGMNKPESAVMTSIEKKQLYMGGAAIEGMYIHIRAFGNTGSDAKKKVVESVYAYTAENLGLSSENVYITFEDKEEWGFKGQFLN